MTFCSTPTFAEHLPIIGSKAKYETAIHNSAKYFSSYEKKEKMLFPHDAIHIIYIIYIYIYIICNTCNTKFRHYNLFMYVYNVCVCV